MTDNVRSIDGNWTVYWRKLYGLLTETARSIDEYGAIYWCKQSSRFSSFWGRENVIIAEFWHPRFRGHLAFFTLLSAFWRLENAILPNRETKGSSVPSFVWANFPHFGSLEMRFLTIRESNVSRCRAKRVEISFFFEAWKCDFSPSRVSNFFAFCWTENAISADL